MSLSPEGVEFVRQLVRQHTGVSLDADKGYLVESRVLELSRREGMSPEQFMARLRFGGEEDLQRRVIESILNTETTFFRDFATFEAFRGTALPELIRRRGPERRLNLWSAACSTGQEPYSLAMILHQVQPPLTGWTVRLLASDYSSSALDYARAGRYTQMEVNRGLPAGFLVSCFEQDDSHWVVREEIRRRVEFQRINLMGPWPLWGAMDVIFLRNILIYFEMDARRGVLRRLRGALKPDGYLFLGGTETIINVDEGFEAVPMGRAVAYRLKPAAGGIS